MLYSNQVNMLFSVLEVNFVSLFILVEDMEEKMAECKQNNFIF